MNITTPAPFPPVCFCFLFSNSLPLRANVLFEWTPTNFFTCKSIFQLKVEQNEGTCPFSKSFTLQVTSLVEIPSTRTYNTNKTLMSDFLTCKFFVCMKLNVRERKPNEKMT